MRKAAERCRGTIGGPQRGRNNIAQGRASAPWVERGDNTNAESVLHGVTRLFNPVGVADVSLDRYPGCAARPWALLFDRFAVMKKRRSLVNSHWRRRWLSTELPGHQEAGLSLEREP